MYKGPNDKHYDQIIELGLKLRRDGLRIPDYTLLILIDMADVDAMNSARGLAETIDPFEEPVIAQLS